MTDAASRRTAGGILASDAGTAARLDESFGGHVAVVVADLCVDTRGHLTAFDLDRLPFTVRRVFTVTDVPLGTHRGGHRHLRGAQALFCLGGRIDVELRRGNEHHEITLVPDGRGLQIWAGVWSRQHYALARSELLVLASEPYDPNGYHPDPLGEP